MISIDTFFIKRPWHTSESSNIDNKNKSRKPASILKVFFSTFPGHRGELFITAFSEVCKAGKRFPETVGMDMMISLKDDLRCMEFEH